MPWKMARHTCQFDLLDESLCLYLWKALPTLYAMKKEAFAHEEGSIKYQFVFI